MDLAADTPTVLFDSFGRAHYGAIMTIEALNSTTSTYHRDMTVCQTERAEKKSRNKILILLDDFDDIILE